MEFRIDSFETSMVDRGIFSVDEHECCTAKVILGEQDAVMFVSRYDDENYWGVDAVFGHDSYPLWSNGTGSRLADVRTIGDPDIIHALDARRDSIDAVRASSPDMSIDLLNLDSDGISTEPVQTVGIGIGL